MRSRIQRLIRAGLLTGVIDGAFSSVLVAFVYGSTVLRLWQRVASTLIGQGAFDGGARTAAIGLLMHFGVAFGWSAVFLVLYEGSATVRRATSSMRGIIAAAAVYGPLIWIAMSLVILPLLGAPAVINARWLVQLVGHFPFVGLPIVWAISQGKMVRSEPLGTSRLPR
jgi:hypothetical protein